jgi:hypothetical protein
MRAFAVVLLFAIASCVTEVGTTVKGGECDGPATKPCRGALQCIAGRCACNPDKCTTGKCDANGICVP